MATRKRKKSVLGALQLRVRRLEKFCGIRGYASSDASERAILRSLGIIVPAKISQRRSTRKRRPKKA